MLGRIAEEHLESGGKRVRARLAMAAASALGVEPKRVAPWAAAVELAHNASLIHDDLQDGDTHRRGRPTTWVRWGCAQAINAGDLMLVLPFLLVQELEAEAEAEVRSALSRALASALAAMCRGQAEEPELASACAQGRGREAYERCVLGKTGALFGVCVQGAALLAGEAEGRAAALGEVFGRLGVLFQLQDDLLDLYGEKGRERPGNDLREGKVTALVVEHLERYPADAPWLFEVLAYPRDATPDAAVDEAAERFRRGGALDGVLQWAARLVTEVEGAPALRGRPALKALARELVQRILHPIAHLFYDREDVELAALALVAGEVAG